MPGAGILERNYTSNLPARIVQASSKNTERPHCRLIGQRKIHGSKKGKALNNYLVPPVRYNP
jgi:hypothetical protein